MSNPEFIERRLKADEISGRVKELNLLLFITGSVAYNPEKVNSESDLDLIGVADFSKLDFERLYDLLGVEFNSEAVKLASEKVINNLSIIFHTSEFEVGLHLWDLTALNNVINLQGFNTTFRDETNKGLQSTSDTQIFRSLRGKEKEVNKEPKKIKEGTILKFFPYVEDEEDFYPNIQVYNLILKPQILIDSNSMLEKSIILFRENLRKKLIKIYGKNQGRNLSLCLPLPKKIINKLSPELKNELDTFF